jgi:Zn-dependent protease
MFKFTKSEIRDLMIAFIVLSFCFAISNVGLDAHGILSILPIVMIGVGVGFLLHELGHKFVAMKYGCEAEFKVWPLGLLIAFVTAFLGFVFASPGEAHIYADHITDEINGKISVAGPMANMVLALIFIAIAVLVYPFKVHSGIFNLAFLICTVGFSVNSFLATFNLLPIYSLDGTKVLKWNVGIWIVVFVIAALMMLISMAIGAEEMVTLLIGI